MSPRRFTVTRESGFTLLEVLVALLVLSIGLIGLAGRYALPAKFDVIKGKDARDFDAGYVQICEDPEVCHINPSTRRNVVLVVVFLMLWLIPVIALYVLLPQRVFYTEALFFTKAAFLTFGGAYAVLAYIAQAGVEHVRVAPVHVDGHDPEAIAGAITLAQDETDRPTLIGCRTHIGYGSPNKQDTAGVHGAPLGPDEVRLTKEALGWPADAQFLIPDRALARFRQGDLEGALALLRPMGEHHRADGSGLGDRLRQLWERNRQGLERARQLPHRPRGLEPRHVQPVAERLEVTASPARQAHRALPTDRLGDTVEQPAQGRVDRGRRGGREPAGRGEIDQFEVGADDILVVHALGRHRQDADVARRAAPDTELQVADDT